MPNRILRDWTDIENVNNLSAEAEVLLVRILMKLDVKGKLISNPRVIRAYCFPLKKIPENKITKWIQELTDNDLIHYNSDGKTISINRTNIFRQRLCSSKWRIIVKQVFERDNYTCSYCGQYGGKLECDHIIPFSKGGTDELENLTTACKSCNQTKKDMYLEDFLKLKSTK
ncbi:HNH endonuclease [Chryseobacterium gallinarum]|uniref:HNH endonuclease n=1 Tax=Chryseobacterium gallinarum TaxID=1324352 RepID=A0ABX6KUD3_CHRGL|nr:HNH endonuclease [Chryseobacterium gallinarum]QIY92211.1 HNH endonuclease [Chryseobacterium gallinarum]